MRILSVRRWATLDADQRTRLLARSTAAIFEPGLVASIERLFADVRTRGDAAVVEATQQFDGVAITPGDLRVRPEELAAAHAEISPELMVGIREAIANSRLFNEAQVRATAAGWRQEVRPGFLVGEQVAAIPSVGLYVPAGKGSFPSVLCQIGTPAVVAGVPEIMVLIPPMPGTGRVDPATLATAHELGLANVFRANWSLPLAEFRIENLIDDHAVTIDQRPDDAISSRATRPSSLRHP